MNFTVLAVNIDLEHPEQLNASNINTFKLETIGGNHTRVALQELSNQHRHIPTHVTAKVYTNLDYLTALEIGYLHNQIHQNAKQETFFDKVQRYRRMLQQVSGKKDAFLNISDATIEGWKNNIMSVEGYKTVSIF